jgi:RimJ/RimL family protein N-acetyltransferase
MEFDGLFIKLRKIEPKDIDLVANWLSSDEFENNLYAITSNGGKENNTDHVIQFMQENADDFCPNKYFIIENKSRAVPIGLSLIKNIDWKNRTAEHNYIIGEEASRNGVYGGDVSLSVCYYLFNNLNLRVIKKTQGPTLAKGDNEGYEPRTNEPGGDIWRNCGSWQCGVGSNGDLENPDARVSVRKSYDC